LKWNDQQQQNDVYHHQEDDWMPAINKQVDLSYGHDHRMIRSYQSLCEASRKYWFNAKISQRRKYWYGHQSRQIQPYFCGWAAELP